MASNGLKLQRKLLVSSKHLQESHLSAGNDVSLQPHHQTSCSVSVDRKSPGNTEASLKVQSNKAVCPTRVKQTELLFVMKDEHKVLQLHQTGSCSKNTQDQKPAQVFPRLKSRTETPHFRFFPGFRNSPRSRESLCFLVLRAEQNMWLIWSQVKQN